MSSLQKLCSVRRFSLCQNHQTVDWPRICIRTWRRIKTYASVTKAWEQPCIITSLATHLVVFQGFAPKTGVALSYLEDSQHDKQNVYAVGSSAAATCLLNTKTMFYWGWKIMSSTMHLSLPSCLAAFWNRWNMHWYVQWKMPKENF